MKLVVLDRDGVINHDSDAYIKSAEEWIPIDGSLEAIARLYHGGYRVVVASNQSGLSRGLFTIDDLNAIHRKMHRELARHGAQVEAIFFCPHSPNDGCQCRKPKPGLLLDISERVQMSLSGAFVVGDSFRDIQAAQRVGASPILVLTGNGMATREKHRKQLEDVPIFSDLLAAVEAIVPN